MTLPKIEDLPVGTRAEEWPEDLLRLWEQAPTRKRIEALHYRFRLREAQRPAGLPQPTCPLLLALRQLELTYRRQSACVGAVPRF